jgi:hypothetical protein
MSRKIARVNAPLMYTGSYQLHSVSLDRLLDVFEQRVVGDGDGRAVVRLFHDVFGDGVDVQQLQDDAHVAVVVRVWIKMNDEFSPSIAWEY